MSRGIVWVVVRKAIRPLVNPQGRRYASNAQIGQVTLGGKAVTFAGFLVTLGDQPVTVTQS